MSDLHPQRYPTHTDPEKGQIHGGECNRTACTDHGATWWNIETRGLYCPADARGINEFPMKDRGPLCIEVERKPTIDEMDELYRRFYGYGED